MALEHNSIIFLLGLSISLIFVFLDFVFQMSLARVGISYGGVRLPLTVLFFIRGVIVCLWLIFFSQSIVSHLLLRWQVFNRIYVQYQKPLLILILLNLLLLVFEIYIFGIEPTRLTVTRLSVELPGLTKPIRLVQLSDIHVELASSRERKLPNLVNNLQPDIIVLTGDYLNESFRKSEASQQLLKDLLSQFQAPLGIYAVNGNVETRVNMESIFTGTRIQPIDNEIVYIPQSGVEIALVGVEFNKWYEDVKILDTLMAQVDPQDFSILLYHKPDLAYAARDDGIDLYLTGHTHGGQFRIPFYGAVVTDSRFGKEFEMGQYQVGNTMMFVSRGIGMAGGIAPRVRFLCPPEVVVIDLVPAK